MVFVLRLKYAASGCSATPPRANTVICGSRDGVNLVTAFHSSGLYQLSTQKSWRCSEFVVARTRTPWITTSSRNNSSLPARRVMWPTAASTRASRRLSLRSMDLSWTAVRVLVRVITLPAPIGVPGHSMTSGVGAGGEVYWSDTRASWCGDRVFPSTHQMGFLAPLSARSGSVYNHVTVSGQALYR